MPLGGLLAGVGAIGAATIGAVSSSSGRDQQQQQIQNAIDQFTKIGVPPTEATQIVLQKYKSAGALTPELEQTFTQQNSNLNNVQTDPRYTQAQDAALNQLQQNGAQGGLNLADRAALNDAASRTATQNRGAQQAILSNANQRGQLGSGNALAAQLSSQQNSANQAQSNALNIGAQAQQRALQSMLGAGQLGGQMQNQQYTQKANAAQAQDAINRFNTVNSQNVQNQNTAMKNYGQQYNLQNNQNIANQNTAVGNQQAMYNAQQVQQNFQNQLQKASGASGQYQTAAKNFGDQAQANANMWGGIGQGIGQMGGAYQQQQNYNNWLDKAYPKQTSTSVPSTSWAGGDDSGFGGVV